VKPAGILGMRKYLKSKSNELAMNNKNIRDLYRGTNEYKRGYQPRSRMRMVMCLQIPTIF
jgi:hypothetical protein